MPPYHLHPLVVHFPIAFLILGLGCILAAPRLRRAPWLDDAAKRLLWLGTASLWAALGLGLLAARTAPHVPLAWEVLAEHRALGLWTAGSFTALAILHGWLRRRRWMLALAWIAATALLLSTAYHGGLLVYHFGMGVGRGE